MNNKMRIYHRYLGFFLAGVMAVYAISGVVLIFRDTDFLKSERKVEKTLATNLPDEEVGRALKIKEFKVDRVDGDVVYFQQGVYNKTSGVAEYRAKQLPFVLDKMTKLHKANTSSPLFYFNIFFGFSLLFFVVSAFWMFLKNENILRQGLYFAAGGILLTLILMFF